MAPGLLLARHELLDNEIGRIIIVFGIKLIKKMPPLMRSTGDVGIIRRLDFKRWYVDLWVLKGRCQRDGDSYIADWCIRKGRAIFIEKVDHTSFVGLLLRDGS